MKEKNLQDELKTDWIENLALDELNMEESGIVHFTEFIDPSLYLEEASLKFMDHLRDQFELYIIKFNSFRNNGNSPDQQNAIRIFKISNTVNDFMLFRNSLKLIVSRRSCDLIQISLYAKTNETTSVNNNFNHEIRAHVGPFNNISFKYMGENIEVDSLVRHYLTEFVRQSAR